MKATHPSVRIAGPKDALRIRQIIQHSSVANTFFVGGQSPAALKQVSQIVDSMRRCSWMLWDGGLVLVVPINPLVAELHVAVLPEWRGQVAIDTCQVIAHMIFTRTSFTLLVGRTPIENRAACMFAQMVGMKHVRETPTAVISSMSFFDWLISREDPEAVLAACAEYETEGKAKHARMAVSWITRGEIFPQELQHGS